MFFSNKKRYEDLKETTKECALLLTSNIDADNECMMFNYGTYLARESGVSDNALLMVLNLLKIIGIKKVTIAGFDGYISEKNFYKGTLELLLDKEYMDRLNKTIAANIDALGRDMEIVSLTPSKYFRKERK